MEMTGTEKEGKEKVRCALASRSLPLVGQSRGNARRRHAGGNGGGLSKGKDGGKKIGKGSVIANDGEEAVERLRSSKAISAHTTMTGLTGGAREKTDLLTRIVVFLPRAATLNKNEEKKD